MSNNPQTHLNNDDMINLGSFYTPRFVVDMVYEMLECVANLREFTLLDSSCGYGDFFTKNLRYIGADIDEIALQKVPKGVQKFHTNSLENIHRNRFKIAPNEPLIIIGNPPYNDKTSELKSRIKKAIYSIDSNIKHRDLGISFMRSFALLEPEFICVLHPLSYLIKRANFTSLGVFNKHYRLKNALVISSQIFTPHSKTFFPILIALYEKNAQGMDYEFIKNVEFKTLEGVRFRLNDFEFISNYVVKYPNHNHEHEAVAYFYTLRDINALKRNRTFLDKPITNSIKVFKENLKYYCYIHHFKHHAKNLPYFLGNFEVFIDNEAFLRLENEFLELKDSPKIGQYFKHLFKDFV